MSQAIADGDAFPPGTRVMELYLTEARQMYHSIDPSPFRERDLDPSAEEFIVGWARELPRDAPLGLRITLAGSAGDAEEPAILREAIHRFFAQRSVASAQRLRRLFEVGRTSLLIGLVVLGALFLIGGLVVRWTGDGAFGALLRESLLIGGWVAMWRPLEIFLYDWWPIRADRRLFDRLSAMPVRVRYAGGEASRG
jgi:hypothetical protein